MPLTPSFFDKRKSRFKTNVPCFNIEKEIGEGSGRHQRDRKSFYKRKWSQFQFLIRSSAARVSKATRLMHLPDGDNGTNVTEVVLDPLRVLEF